MRTFMSTLNRTERLILLLFYADQLSQTEISLVLGLPESKVNEMLGSLKDQAVTAMQQGAVIGVPSRSHPHTQAPAGAAMS